MTGLQTYQKLWTAFSSQRHLAPQELSVHIIAFSVIPESSHYGEIHDRYSRASNTMTPIVMIPGVSMVPTTGLMPSVMHPTTVL